MQPQFYNEDRSWEYPSFPYWPYIILWNMGLLRAIRDAPLVCLYKVDYNLHQIPVYLNSL